MLFDQTKGYFKYIIIRAARLPACYLAIGMILIALSSIDSIFPLTSYKHIFDITDTVGKIFIALSLLTFIYKTLTLLFQFYENKLLEHNQLASLILGSVRKSLSIIFLLAVINIIITLSGPDQSWLFITNNIINVIIIGSIGWIAIQILYTLDAVVFARTTTHADDKRAKALYTKTHVIRNVLTVVIVLLTFAAILMSFSSVRNIGISLLASAGFLTAIIGLASQKTLSSIFSGLQIALSQPIKIGDIVVIENESGIIEEIKFTYARLKMGDRRRMILPISYFIEKPFINWSHDPEGMRSSISFHIDYMMPIQPLRDHLNAILSTSKFWDGKASKLHVADLGERSVELRVLVSAANEDDLADLRAEVREKILNYIRDNYSQYFPIFRFKQDVTETH